MFKKPKAPAFLAMIAGMLAGTWGKAADKLGPRTSARGSKYRPHQGKRECARRAAAIEAGRYDERQIQRGA